MLNKLSLLLCLVFLSFCGRQWVVENWGRQSQDLFMKSHPLSENAFLSVRLLNFKRGDFVVSLHNPPFRPKHFTVNRWDGSIIAWD